MTDITNFPYCVEEKARGFVVTLTEDDDGDDYVEELGTFRTKDDAAAYAAFCLFADRRFSGPCE